MQNAPSRKKAVMTTSASSFIRSIAVVSLLATALVSLPARSQSVDPDPDQLVLKVTGQAGSRAVTSVSRKLEWNVRAMAGGSAKVALRVPVASFESAQPGVDAELSKALHAERYPNIEIEGVVQGGFAAPARFVGTIRFHGHTQPFTALLSLTRAATQLAVSTQLAIDLDSFGVDLPQISGSRLERNVNIDFSVLLSLHPQAVVSGGFISPAAASFEN
jgi:polyisoprenoid-binding protein YceI